MPLRETKNGQVRTTDVFTCPLPSTQTLIVWAFESLVNPKFLKISKIFHDIPAAISDKGTDTTDSDAPTQALIPKILQNIQLFSPPQHPRNVCFVAISL